MTRAAHDGIEILPPGVETGIRDVTRLSRSPLTVLATLDAARSVTMFDCCGLSTIDLGAWRCGRRAMWFRASGRVTGLAQPSCRFPGAPDLRSLGLSHPSDGVTEDH